MATEDEEPEVDHKVYTTFIRLAFTPYAIHFKSAKYMKEETLNRIDSKVVKETLRLTGLKSYIRVAIGSNRPFWEELVGVFRTAVTSLERRSFQQWDPSSVDYETTSSTLIASAYPGLWKDLDRLNDLVAIARNVLTAGEEVQDLCADCGFDQQMFKLINCCVRVTARGYDGDAGTGDEEKWQSIVNAYKKLLITSLQFLNNLSARNEKRKLLLWMALFDNGEPFTLSPRDVGYIDEGPIDEEEIFKEFMPGKLHRSLSESDTYRAAHKLGEMSLADSTAQLSEPQSSFDDFLKGDELGRKGFAMLVRSALKDMEEQSVTDIEPVAFGQQMRQEWLDLRDADRQFYKDMYLEHNEDRHRFKELQESATSILSVERDNPVVVRLAEIEKELHVELKGHCSDRTNVRRSATAPPCRNKISRVPWSNAKMKISAFIAERRLASGKADLMKRINADASTDPVNAAASEHAVEPALGSLTPSEKESEEESEEEEEDEEDGDEEEEYHGSNEDGRGLLTDVPLILGPSEIEILPNMIMSGLVPQAIPNATVEQVNAMIDMHTQRCHLLLAQENGRNLLRELLIFVAAWDLREEELYFKFMVKILESILVNGLLPYAYHAFRDYSKSRSKDIISPAQAVIMKLLTNIFRARAEASKNALLETGHVQEPSPVEIHVVNYIFIEFRQRIVPQTCALIFLQGRIHDNMAPPEDFPLNLWDMERMYEGVYQYLEFFAVLTEEQSWKDIMAQWQVASELVTMLKELEGAIPKLNPGVQLPTPGKATAKDQAEKLFEQAEKLLPASASLKPGQWGKAPPPKDKARTPTPPPPIPPPPLNVAGDTIVPQAPVDPDAQAPYPEEAQDEPSDFEWRNLKKLTVLVLSSLIWKNKAVQDQVRQFGGLEALVGCCRHDEHNPYIREHAIMCLRFAVEGNPENAEVIRKMADQFNAQIGSLKGGTVTLRGAGPVAEVPKEVLDTQGYETFMDGKGQVGLRRKEVVPHGAAMKGSAALQAAAAQAIQGAIAGTHGLSGTLKGSAALQAAAQAIQGAIAGTQGLAGGKFLQEMPLPASLDKDSREAIARLNKAALEHVDLMGGGTAQSKK
ncbi:hypothetical protein CAC42_2220 [Sphaceloma murrayae]|uniref:Ataxin-10 homolog n=1 Tax=Sphaceloma murrayae TaxID=2082308 RepID=A0A2K1QJ59_9PEZI|nr:hypothetical protein CAC42_2220 [Sphaceloma murrayae]